MNKKTTVQKSISKLLNKKNLNVKHHQELSYSAVAKVTPVQCFCFMIGSHKALLLELQPEHVSSVKWHISGFNKPVANKRDQQCKLSVQHYFCQPWPTDRCLAETLNTARVCQNPTPMLWCQFLTALSVPNFIMMYTVKPVIKGASDPKT